MTGALLVGDTPRPARHDDVLSRRQRDDRGEHPGNEFSVLLDRNDRGSGPVDAPPARTVLAKEDAVTDADEISLGEEGDDVASGAATTVPVLWLHFDPQHPVDLSSGRGGHPKDGEQETAVDEALSMELAGVRTTQAIFITAPDDESSPHGATQLFGAAAGLKQVHRTLVPVMQGESSRGMTDALASGDAEGAASFSGDDVSSAVVVGAAEALVEAAPPELRALETTSATERALEHLAPSHEESVEDQGKDNTSTGHAAGDAAEQSRSELSNAGSEGRGTHSGDGRNPGPNPGANAPVQTREVRESVSPESGTRTTSHEPLASDTPERIVQAMRLQFARGGGDAVVHIKPEHLGPLSVSLRVEHGLVAAAVYADRPAVIEWLQSNEASLREALKASGLELDRLVIHRDPEQAGRHPQRDPGQPRRQPRPRASEAESTFQINV